MPLIDISYFEGATLLRVDGNETAINNAIADYEPEYLDAVMGKSLYDAFIAGLAAGTGGTYFSNQFTNQFFKGNIAERWLWIRDGHTFTYNNLKVRWPGFKNEAKRSPAANYVYWYYLSQRNPYPNGLGGFSTAKQENATVVGPFQPAMRAWNDMVKWNVSLYTMISTLTGTDGALVYPEFVRNEIDCNIESLNVYTQQTFL